MEWSACLDPTGTSAKLAKTPPVPSGVPAVLPSPVPGTATVPGAGTDKVSKVSAAATAALKTPLFQTGLAAGFAAGTATLSVGVAIAVVC